MEIFCRTFTLSWDGIEIVARHRNGHGPADADMHGEPLDCIEIEVVEPAGAWLAIGCSRGIHKVSRARIARYGDAGGYVAAWLAHAARADA